MELTTAAPLISHSSPQREGTTDYLFVNNVRFLSMAAVVALHNLGWMAALSGDRYSSQLHLIMVQPFKFGTIGFYLISGFLMGEGLTRRSPREYLSRRLRTIFAPWLLWFSLFCVMQIANDILLGRLDLHARHNIFSQLFDHIYSALFSTAYWFVPNLLISLCILLLCGHFLYNLRLGLTLAALSLFYGLNLYTHWIAALSHTHALFGYVFYLWLGAWTAHHAAAVMAWIARIPMPAMIALAVLAWCAALCESEFLSASGPGDPLYTLRISNQFYSVAMVLAIFKVRKALWPRVVNVRATTFGVYLSHGIVLALLMKTFRFIKLGGIASRLSDSSAVPIVCFALVGFAITYASSLALTMWLLHYPRLRWTVGNFASVRPWQSAGKPL
jgi:hypothetical protein